MTEHAGSTPAVVFTGVQLAEQARLKAEEEAATGGRVRRGEHFRPYALVLFDADANATIGLHRMLDTNWAARPSGLDVLGRLLDHCRPARDALDWPRPLRERHLDKEVNTSSSHDAIIRNFASRERLHDGIQMHPRGLPFCLHLLTDPRSRLWKEFRKLMLR